MSDEVKVPEINNTESSDTVSEAPVEVNSDKKILTPVLSKIVKLPTSNTEIEIHKLKAGPYYKAQQLFTEWIHSVSKVLTVSKIDPNKLLDKNGEPDIASANKMISKKVGDKEGKAITEASQESLLLRIEFLASCMEMTKEKFNTKFYPEEVEVLGPQLIEINGFMENLKKSVAPTGQKKNK